MYDIVIVGGGPAGATLARLLRPSWKVLIIEKRDMDKDYESGWTKCCGGLLAPDAQKVLASLGLGVPKEVIVGPQLFTVKTIDYDNHINKHYQRHYINVDREKFDRWLFSLIPDQVTKEVSARFKGYKELSDGTYEVTYKKDGEVHKVNTSIIVGADGGFSTIRKKVAPDTEISKYASIQEWFKLDKKMPYFTTIFDQEVTDFYSWTIPKEDYLIVGSAIPFRQDVNKRFNILKEKLLAEGFPLTSPCKREGAYILRPKKRKSITLGKDRIFMLGEAAGFISPSSAEGFSYGMRSAIYLSKVINNNGINATVTLYGKAARKLYSNIHLKNMKGIVMYQPLLRHMTMKSGVLSMNLVEEE